MLINRDYMLKKGLGPSAPKFFIDTRVVPFAVNMAGSLEGLLDRASVRTGVRPAVLLGGTAGILSLLLLGLLRRRRPLAARPGRWVTAPP